MAWQRFRRIVQRVLRNPHIIAILGALAVFALLFFLGGQATGWYEEQLLMEQRAEAVSEASVRANAITQAINRRLARLQGLHAFVQTEASSPNFGANFERFATGLYRGSRGIRNFALAPGGVVQYVYPLQGNEAVLGYAPGEDPRPEIRADVERAISSQQVTLSGPTELVQGGLGLIARQAVIRDGEYWGLVNLVLDIPPLLVEAGVDNQSDQMLYALRDSQQRVFYGPEDLFHDNPAVVKIVLPEGDWELAGIPQSGWPGAIQQPLQIFQGTGLTIVILLASLTYLVVERQARLSQAVLARTRELSNVNIRLQQDIAERQRTEAALREREAQYRSIFESTSDGLIIHDLEGHFVTGNPALSLMHGYTPEEFSQLPPTQFIHPDSQAIMEDYIEAIRAGRRFRGQFTGVRKDGSLFFAELLGVPLIYRGKPHGLSVIRDVSEQVQAYHLLETRVQERTRELSTLLEISRSIASTLELNPLLSLILDKLRDVLDYQSGTILTLEEGGFTVRAYHGPQPVEKVLFTKFPVDNVLGEELIVRRSPVIIPDIDEDSALARSLREASGDHFDGSGQSHSWMGIPLIVKTEVIGMLAIQHSGPNYYTPADAELAVAFANQMAVAIENARLYEKAQDLAVLQERQRLARDLHDSVSQALYGIALGTRTAQTMVSRANDGLNLQAALREPLDYVLSMAEAGLAEMRALIFELRPESLATEGLVAALGKQTAALQARHHIQVTTTFCEEPAVPLEIKEAIYRMAQEAMHNVVKHAQASQVTVTLTCQGRLLRLEVIDNGVGFDVQADFPGHLGLRSMRERVQRLRGRLIIDSRTGEGTRLVATIPVVSQSEPALDLGRVDRQIQD